jgi:hypothetical protein
MLHLGSSSCVARAARPPTLGSVSPHIFPPCPSKPTKWVLPKRIPVPDMARLGRSFSQPGESPGPLEEAAGLSIGVESTLIPSSYSFPYVPRGPQVPCFPQSSSSPMHFASGTIPLVSPSSVPQCPPPHLSRWDPWCPLSGAIGRPPPRVRNPLSAQGCYIWPEGVEPTEV